MLYFSRNHKPLRYHSNMEHKKILFEIFGFNSFRQGQQEIISKVLVKKSACAIFPTGAGKSLCYQLPATQLNGLTLVISPLLSLMKDQIDFLQKHKIASARLDSSLEREQYNTILQQAKGNQLKILMISVERFKNERFRQHLRQMPISLMVIDEAHCISEWGHNFRPDYLKLPKYQQEFNIPQVLLLTATATKQVIKDMQEKFAIVDEDVVVTGFYRNNLFLKMSPTASESRKEKLAKIIQKQINHPTIVYVTLQKTAQEVATYLQSKQIDAQFYHAGIKSEEREIIQNQFMQGQCQCIVATIAFGMGIDKKDVRRVIHYDLPKSIENYSQEIGRAGRDGSASLCQVIANDNDITVHENFVYGDTPEKSAITSLLQSIAHCEESFWEIKLHSLSIEFNIRLLPLKTLLVYLEMEGIIQPKYTYFDQYSFKSIDNANQIVNKFQGEHKEFITAIFNHCKVNKVWTTVDIPAILQNYSTQRSRIIVALEYLEQQGSIELHAKQAVERFDIVQKQFDLQIISDKMYKLFEKKERAEIERIDRMLDFFESKNCLSVELAHYFGEELDIKNCGHCSVCKNSQAIFRTPKQQTFERHDFQELSQKFTQQIAGKFSIINLTKFLCGIDTPHFRRIKAKQMVHFGSLARYPFADVKNWVKLNYEKT